MNELIKAAESYGITVPEEEQQALARAIRKRTARKKAIIFRQTETCKEVIYLIRGITASVFNYDGKEVVTRFFQTGNFSSNIVSAVQKSPASDYLIAITEVEYLAIPFEYFQRLYLYSNAIGLFIRKKLIENSIENKKLTSAKTIPDLNVRYQYLLEYYPQVIRDTPAKYVAKFLGVTPEGYSRFLAKRRTS
ncbi:MAG: cyclic nucleotide-binding domain-containing protein [Bacteroidota bacterium]